MERLDRLLASTGRWGRREAKSLIRGGRVRVDGTAVVSPDAKIDRDRSVVQVDGEILDLRPVTWILLNKPAGYLSATEDGSGPVVLDLLSPDLRRKGLFPVGRLDKDTEGLLLLTDDGPLAHALLSPRRHVQKVYLARTGRPPSAGARSAFADGLVLPDGTVCRPAGLEILDDGTVRVTVTEGKFHQVKRMLAACGAPVLHLERVSMGGLPLDPSLPRGAYRFLTEDELLLLRRSVQISPPPAPEGESSTKKEQGLCEKKKKASCDPTGMPL